jgi:hypothetical protein
MQCSSSLDELGGSLERGRPAIAATEGLDYIYAPFAKPSAAEI